MSSRFFIIVSFIALLSLVAVATERLYSYVSEKSSLAAVFTNDSEIVEVADDGSGGSSGNSVSSGADTTGSSGGEGDSSGNNSQGSNNSNTNDNELVITFDNEDSTSTNGGSPLVEQIEVTVSTGGGSNDATGTSSGVQTQSTQTINTNEILTALIGNQAFIETQGGGSGGGTLLKLHANRVRAALRARNIVGFSVADTNFILQSSRERGGVLTRSDFALFVSAAVLKDESVQDVSYSAGTLNTEYRALGRLFGVIPLWYTLRISVQVTEAGLSNVQVRFPWYKFFLATGVSRAGLEQELRSDIALRIQEVKGEFDIATEAFNATANILKLRVGV